MREKTTADALNKKREKLQKRMKELRDKRNAEIQKAADEARYDPVLREFLRLRGRMEEVEGVVKGSKPSSRNRLACGAPTSIVIKALPDITPPVERPQYHLC